MLDEYDGRGWKRSGSDLNIEIHRYGRLKFKDTPSATLSSARYSQSFFPRVTETGAVFTGYSPGYIALHEPAIEGNQRQRAQENTRRLLENAAGYRVISAIPRLTPEVLVEDSADWSYMIGRNRLDVPQRVRDLAELIVAGSTSHFQMAARIERYLLDNYEYDLRVSPLSRSDDVVDAFLFERRSGYCAQFATAMAVMARSVGRPVRVATGYVPGGYNSLTGAHTVRLQDAHAWVEIKFVKAEWVAFDPTSRPDLPWAIDRSFSGATRTVQQIVRTHLKDLVVGGASSATGAASAIVLGVGPVVGIAMGLVLAVVLVAGLAGLVRHRIRARTAGHGGYSFLPGPDRQAVRETYRRALRMLSRKGYPTRRSYQSPDDYVASLMSQGLPLPEWFEEFSRHATHALYDPRPLDLDAPGRAKTSLGALKAQPRLS